MIKNYHFQLGVELLNNEDKTPIEHIEYETTHNFEEALNIYENWNLENNTAKYLAVVDEDSGEFITLTSKGYKQE